MVEFLRKINSNFEKEQQEIEEKIEGINSSRGLQVERCSKCGEVYFAIPKNKYKEDVVIDKTTEAYLKHFQKCNV